MTSDGAGADSGDRQAKEEEQHHGPSTSGSNVDIACKCLNIRLRGRLLEGQQSGEGRHDDDEEDEDGAGAEAQTQTLVLEEGSFEVTHPSLVTSSTSRQSRTRRGPAAKGSDDAPQASSSQAKDTQISCVNCDRTILTFAASSRSTLLNPLSVDGKFSIDTDACIVGEQSIRQAREASSTASAYSDVFQIILIGAGQTAGTGTNDVASSLGSNNKNDDDDDAKTAARALRVLDSRLENLQPDDASGGGMGQAGRGGRSIAGIPPEAISNSVFHAAARDRIKRDRQELDAKIIRLRAEHESKAQKYLAEADTLAGKALAAGQGERGSRRGSATAPKMRRGSSSHGGKGSSASRSANRSPASGKIMLPENTEPPLVIQRGFNAPSSPSSGAIVSSPSAKVVSPHGHSLSPTTGSRTGGAAAASSSPGENSSSGGTNSPSPYLIDSASAYPGLFQSLNLPHVERTTPTAAEDRSGPSPGPVPVPEVAQPVAPQSPTMRRSRSPSPSRNASRDRQASSRDAPSNVQDAEARQRAVGSKRPALDLDKDVLSIGRETASITEPASVQIGASDAAAKLSSSLKAEKVPAVHAALSKATGKNQPTPQKRTTSAWLRLNGLSPPRSPSPVAAREAAATQAQNGDGSSSSPAGPSGSHGERPGTSQRHVSFKEPDTSAKARAGETPVEYAEPEETAFDLDEDMVESGDSDGEGPLENEEEVIAEALSQADERASQRSAEQRSASASAGNQTGTSASVTVGSSGARTITDSLSAAASTGRGASALASLMSDPTSFIGSLRNISSKGFGSANFKPGRTPSREREVDRQSTRSVRSSSSQTSTEDQRKLNEQARRMRELLAMDAPSHRGGRSKRKVEREDLFERTAEDEEIPDDLLDSLAPVSNLATSMPVAIGFPRFNRKEEFEFERKTSVPDRESLLVPKFKNRNIGKPLPLVAEEGQDAERRQYSARHANGSRFVRSGRQAGEEEDDDDDDDDDVEGSPPVAKEAGTSAREDVQVAEMARGGGEGDKSSSRAGRSVKVENGSRRPGDAGEEDVDADEAEEARDSVQDLRRAAADGDEEGAFVPPHIWSRKKVGKISMLGTSVHDYE